MPHLREDVTVTHDEGVTTLIDALTGLSVSLENVPPLEAGGDTVQEPWRTLAALGLLAEGLAPEEIRARQRGARETAQMEARLSAVRELLAFATTHVPYYRARRSVYAPERISSLKDLATLPLLGKPDVRANFPDGLVAEGVDVPGALEEGTLELASTSGTTDERLQVLVDLDLESVPREYEALWDLPASEETPKTAVFTTPVCMGTECHLGRAPFEKRLKNEYTLFLNSTEDLFSIKRDLIENVADELWKFRPDFLLANPFYLHWLGRRAREFGIALPPVKLVLSSYQYLSVLQRRGISRLFGAPVYSYFAATDLGGARMAIECSKGRVHVREDQTLLEIVDGRGLPVDRGSVGAAAVTALANRVMPVVRYLVGDLAKQIDEPCDCAVADWQVVEIHGRAKDMLLLNGRWVTTRDVDEVVGRAKGLDFYRIDQVGPSELQVRAVPSLDESFAPAELEALLREHLGAQKVSVRATTRLDPEGSLKFRLTECRVQKAPSAP